MMRLAMMMRLSKKRAEVVVAAAPAPAGETVAAGAVRLAAAQTSPQVLAELLYLFTVAMVVAAAVTVDSPHPLPYLAIDPRRRIFIRLPLQAELV